MAYTISQNLNIRPKYFPHVVVHVSAGDANIPVHFSIYDGASPYTIPSGTTITVHGYRKDGGNWITSGTYSGNVVSFTLPRAAMAIEGAGIADVVFTTGNEVVGSSNFCLLVERATFPNGVSYSNDSSVFQDLLDFVNSNAVPEAISDWLEENITATSPAVDASLTVQGAAADAKATGDAFTNRVVTQASLTGNVVSFKNANDSEKFTLDLSALDDIKTVTSMNQMTDHSAVYMYTWTEGSEIHNQLYFYNGEWTPLGSGVRTASTASQMTDTNAIYKYTGSESGYIPNALYYYNGTAWKPIVEQSEILQKSVNSTIDEITTSVPSRGLVSNILNPTTVKDLGYYYAFGTGTITQGTGWKVAEQKISLDSDKGRALYMMCNITSSSNAFFLFYNGDTYLSYVFSTLKTDVVALLIPENATSFIFEVQNATDIDPSDIMLSQDVPNPSDFVDYSGTVAIKHSLIDEESIMSGFTEKRSTGINILNPADMIANGENNRVRSLRTKNKIYLGEGVLDIYVMARNTERVTTGGTWRMSCYNGDTYISDIYDVITVASANTLQHKTLPNGTNNIVFITTIGGDKICPSDICVALEPFETFQEYTYKTAIKEDLLPNNAGLSNSKRSSLYGKNVVWLGDSIMLPVGIPEAVGQMVGANITNVSCSSISAAKYTLYQNIYHWWYTLVNIADCMESEDWSDTLEALDDARSQSTAGAGDMYNRMTILSQTDWTKVDLLVVALGANEFAPYIDDNDDENTETYAGAIKYSAEKILTKYPKLRIVFLSTIYSSSAVEKMQTLRDILEDVCFDNSLPFIDNNRTLGINEWTASTYLADGLHPNADGRNLIVNHTAEELW